MLTVTLGDDLRQRAIDLNVITRHQPMPAEGYLVALEQYQGQRVEVEHVHRGEPSQAPEHKGKQPGIFAYTLKLGAGLYHVPSRFVVEEEPVEWTPPTSQ